MRSTPRGRYCYLLAAIASIIMHNVTIASAEDSLELFAIGLNAYNESTSICSYAPIVGETFSMVDAHFLKAEPYLWERAKRKATGSSNLMMNYLNVIGGGPSVDRCADYGFLMRDPLTLAYVLFNPDPNLMTEIERLKAMPRAQRPSEDVGGMMEGPGDQNNPNNNPDLCHLRNGGCNNIGDDDPYCADDNGCE